MNPDKGAERICQYIAQAGFDDPVVSSIRRVIFSQLGKRQTPHGPGKRKKNP